MVTGLPAKRTDRAPGEGFVVLWVNGPGAWEPEVHERLRAAGVQIEACDLSGIVDRVNQRAPDLVVLSGAAGSAPGPIARDLSRAHPASSVPVIAIGPSGDTQLKPRSRFGLVARLDKDAGVEALDKQLRTLLRSLSRRPARWRIPTKASDLEALVEKLMRAKRCGILATPSDGALVLDGATASPTPHELMKKLDSTAEIELTLYERPLSRVHVLTGLPREEETAPTIEGARVLVVDANTERGAKLAARLEQGGAAARAAGPRAKELAAAKSMDPTLIVLCASAALEGPSALWTDPRLAAASLLVLSDDILRMGRPEMVLLGPVATMCRAELGLARQLRKGNAVAERLETLGTARWLKILGRCTDDVTFRLYAAAGRGRVDLAGGKMRGAAFRPADTRMGVVEGRAAIELMMQLPFGRVLAGPPSKLKALEGVRKTRKTSVVGRIAPKKTGGPGKLAAELFVERIGSAATDLAERSSLASQSSNRPAGRATQPARKRGPKPAENKALVVPKPSTLPPPDNEEDEGDPLGALRRELGRAPGISDVPPGPDAGTAKRRKTKRPRKKTKRPRKDRDRSEAVTEPPDDEGSGPALHTPAPLPSEPVVIESIPRPAALPAEARAQGDAESGSARVVYALVIVGALVAGGFAAYRLAYDGEGGSPTAVEPGPEVPPVTPSEREGTPPPDGIDEPEGVDDPGTDPPDDPPEGATTDDEPAVDEPSLIEPGPVDPPAAGTTVEELVQGSLDASRARQFDRSERLARQALALSPHNAQAGYRLAVALYRRRQYDEALQWAERAERWDATTPLPASLRGDIYLRTGRFVSAAEAYERALEIEPAFGPAQRQLAQIRERRGIGPQRPPPSPETPENPFE